MSLGLVLNTHSGNPLQDMLLAPFTVFEDGRRFIRMRSDQTVNLHMAVTISDDVESLSKIKPVLYRFNGQNAVDILNPSGMCIESHWYSNEYDRAL